MLVLITGAAGLIGSHIMVQLLKDGHSILATDINPLPPVVTDQIKTYLDRVRFVTGDLCNVKFIDELFEAAPSPIEGVMHIGGIRSPVGLDPRLVHSINVVAAYNVMQTAAARGVRRMVQASSCNALGLSWTMPEHWGLDFVPINETHPMRPVSLFVYLLGIPDLSRRIHIVYPSCKSA